MNGDDYPARPSIRVNFVPSRGQTFWLSSIQTEIAELIAQSTQRSSTAVFTPSGGGRLEKVL